MEKIPENQKHVKAKIILASITMVIILILIILQFTGNKEEPIIKKPFIKMDKIEKKLYLKEYIEGISDRNVKNQIALENMIKERFNYPEEVLFNEKPYMRRGNIINIDSGYIQINGSGISKNAFGVKGRFYYFVTLQITDSINKIIKLDVE